MWKLTCLICGHTDTSLVSIQEHAMFEHGYRHEHLQQRQTKETLGADHYRWSVDGQPWLEAVKQAASDIRHGG